MKVAMREGDLLEMDFTDENKDLKSLDVNDTHQFIEYIESALSGYARVGIGGYGEDRFIYRRSQLFDGEKEPRSVHLGTDVWVPHGTKVFAPLDATVHSFKNNNRFGDYGGTIILQHELEGIEFYTLYGHLSVASLKGLAKAQRIAQGTHFATIGASDENGHWPPHLHFQLITDMLGYEGDFFGVAPPSEKASYMELCPNPRLILKLG